MKIVFLKGISPGTAAEYDLAEVTVGWDKDNTVQLDAVGVSRHHAAIIRKPEGNWIIRDLHSTNGVKVNGNAVEGEAPLFEGDLVTIAEQEFRIEELEAGRGKVDLQPISKREETLPPAAAKTGEDLLQQLRSAGSALFERGSVAAKKEPEKSVKAEDSRIVRRKQWLRLSIVLCILIGAVALWLSRPNPPPPKNKEAAVKAVDLTFYYERVNYDAAQKKAYRLEVQLENGKLTFAVDDLYSQRRFCKTIPNILPAYADDVAQLAQALKDPEFTALTSNPAAVSPDSCDYCRLVAVSGGEVIDLKYPGDGIPVAFSNAAAKIDDFLGKFNLKTILASREEMEKRGAEHLACAKDAYDNYVGNLSGLRKAVTEYRNAIKCYEEFDPPHPNLKTARKMCAEAEKLQLQKIKELNIEFDSCFQQNNLEKLRRVSQEIKELAGEDSQEYAKARERLMQLRSKNKQGGKR